MEKLQSSGSRPLWERKSNERGHKSSVSKALQAHRQRVEERQSRVDSRLQAAKNISNSFFPQAKVEEKVAPMQNQMPQSIANPKDISQELAVVPTSPRQLDYIYDDAQLAPITEHAIAVLEKDVVEAADDGNYEDMPKGSYVDYQV